MDNRANTVAGWLLGAGIVFLGAWLVTGEMFHSGRPEKMGYPIPGVVSDEAPAEVEQPIAHFLRTADATRGEAAFRKCSACHNVTQGGANQLGPNLFGMMGAPIAGRPGYAYSDALKGKGGTWTWDNMSAWLRSPRTFAQGTKMTFAGIADDQERADLLAYLNAQGSNLPLPAAPAAGGDSPGEAAARQADAPAQGDMGRPQAVPKAGPGGQPAPGRGGGPAAPQAGQRPGGH